MPHTEHTHDEHNAGAFSLPLATEPAQAIDPVCGMTVDPATAAGSFAHAGTTYYFCSRHCLEKFKAEPEKYLRGAAAESCCDHSAAAGRAGHEVHLPDAPGDRAGRPRHLPEVRHGTGADDPAGRRGRRSRTARHDAAVLDRRGTHATGVRPRDGTDDSGREAAALADGGQQLGRSRAVHTGRVLGRVAVLRAGRASVAAPYREHVHADRARHVGRVGLQRRRDTRARSVPRRVPRRTRHCSRRTSKPQR